jgi:ABC-type bacteriocin/lantibiotic exporter with double-glycine peptidase domain
VYVGTSGSGYDFSVSKVFTSLVIIMLLSAPLVRLFQVIPQLGGAYGCFQRLNDFLLLEERIDFRKVIPDGDSEVGGPDSPAADTHIIWLRDVSLGWDPKSSPILTNINFEVKKGAKIAIIGSVGTGKTLFLKGLIGEAYKTDGQLTLAPSISLAYCSQTPWLENVSAQQNITQYGKEASDSDYYRQLAFDCALDDLVRLPTFTSGSIGSGGVMLSGGQRQRLVSPYAF